MTSTAEIYLIVSVAVFLILLVVVQNEQRRGRRFFAAGLRVWLDEKIDSVGRWLVSSWNHFIKYIVQLHWYYSIHSLLRAILHVITAFYSYFENIFERNRTRTKKLRAEKKRVSKFGHLGQVAEHKEDTALTTSQKVKLRHKKLEEKH